MVAGAVPKSAEFEPKQRREGGVPPSATIPKAMGDKEWAAVERRPPGAEIFLKGARLTEVLRQPRIRSRRVRVNAWRPKPDLKSPGHSRANAIIRHGLQRCILHAHRQI